jgi:hypothetical protein
MSSGFFEAPAYKLEIGDLEKARDDDGVDGCWSLTLTSDSLLGKRSQQQQRRQGSSSSAPALHQELPRKEVKLELSMIWIQGTVRDILGEGDEPSTLHIEDASGVAYVHEYNNLPGGDHTQITIG